LALCLRASEGVEREFWGSYDVRVISEIAELDEHARLRFQQCFRTPPRRAVDCDLSSCTDPAGHVCTPQLQNRVYPSEGMRSCLKKCELAGTDVSGLQVIGNQ
jgi:hypothetical protein